MKKLILISLAMLLAFSLVACSKTPADTTGGGDSAGTTKLVVATDAPYPPMEMVKDDGTYEGFDIELFEAAAKNVGYSLEFRTAGFDALIASMGAGGGDYDAAISSITITDERAQNMLFSKPYFDANQSVAVPSDSSVASVDDFKSGDKVAVQTGTTGEIWARENLEPKGIEIKGYALIPDCFGGMLAGDVDGIIADFQVAADYAKDPARKAQIVQQIETGEEYGIAFPKGSEAHVEKINEGIDKAVADGTYTEIYKKWFGVEPARLP